MPVSTDDLKPGLIAKARRAGRWVCRRILGFQQYNNNFRVEVEEYNTGRPGRTRRYFTPSMLASWTEHLEPDLQAAAACPTGRHHGVVWVASEPPSTVAPLEEPCPTCS